MFAWILACTSSEERDATLKIQRENEEELPIQVLDRTSSIAQVVKELSTKENPFLVVGEMNDENIYLYFQIWNTSTIPSGNFDRTENDITQHIELDYEFDMMKYEITQGTYQLVMGSNPSHFSNCGLDCPVEKISWFDAVLFANKLNQLLDLESCYTIDKYDISWSKGIECQGWRLPTEAEWEYAARAGTSYKYSGSDNASEVGWYRNNRHHSTQPVGLKKANRWDLYDMSGNVSEWCWDEYQEYTKKTRTNPIGGTQISPFRIYRGGCWNDLAPCMSNTYRRHHYPSLQYQFLGLRLVRTRKTKETYVE